LGDSTRPEDRLDRTERRGESSLFKLIVGEHAPEKGGAVIRAKGVTVGYLPQHPEFDPERTAISLALEGNPRVAEVEAELRRVESKLGEPEVYGNPKSLEKTLDAQHKLLEEFEALGGANYESRVREILRGLGLPESDFEKPVRALSGGQKKLIGLARLMLARPSVLLLDEPDNHLDMPGKAFLEKLINDYDGAVAIISHDRYILDAVASHIAEIEDGRITTFAGNYTEYIIDKEERLARQEELYQIQRREIGRLEMALKRYKQWVVFNDKFATRIHNMEARIDRIDKIDRPVLERRKMDLSLNGWRGSNQVLEFEGVSKVFTHLTSGLDTSRAASTAFVAKNAPHSAQRGGTTRPAILNELNFLIRHGERVGLDRRERRGEVCVAAIDSRKRESDERRDQDRAEREGRTLRAGTRDAGLRSIRAGRGATRRQYERGTRRFFPDPLPVHLSSSDSKGRLALGRRAESASAGVARPIGRQLPPAR
jgi:ATPase subunit of ABC transporter with duplicated ATPase domains